MSTKTISKKAKGLVAVAAGGALLLGGGATFALWEDADTIEGRTITAGGLAVTAEGFTWQYKNQGTTEFKDVPDEGFLMIPGQTVRGTATIIPTVEGTDLVASLTFKGGEWDNKLFEAIGVKWALNGVSKTNTTTGNASGTLGGVGGSAQTTPGVDSAVHIMDVPAENSGDPIVVTVEMVLPNATYRENSKNNALETWYGVWGQGPFAGGAGNAKWTLDDIAVTLTQK